MTNSSEMFIRGRWRTIVFDECRGCSQDTPVADMTNGECDTCSQVEREEQEPDGYEPRRHTR